MNVSPARYVFHFVVQAPILGLKNRVRVLTRWSKWAWESGGESGRAAGDGCALLLRAVDDCHRQVNSVKGAAVLIQSTPENVQLNSYSESK